MQSISQIKRKEKGNPIVYQVKLIYPLDHQTYFLKQVMVIVKVLLKNPSQNTEHVNNASKDLDCSASRVKFLLRNQLNSLKEKLRIWDRFKVWWMIWYHRLNMFQTKTNMNNRKILIERLLVPWNQLTKSKKMAWPILRNSQREKVVCSCTKKGKTLDQEQISFPRRARNHLKMYQKINWFENIIH